MRDTDAKSIGSVPRTTGTQQAYSSLVWNYRQAETVAVMIYIGRELGLFKAMADRRIFIQ